MRRFVPRLLQTARTPHLDPRRSESIDHWCVALGTSPVPRTFPAIDALALRIERYVRAPGTISRFGVAVVHSLSAIHPLLTSSLTTAIEEGRWTPGIGDPSLMGWATVATYVLTAAACGWWAWPRGAGRGIPVMIGVLLLLLAVNKQLDLQSWITQTGRDLVKELGWYEDHRSLQAAFIGGIVLAGVTTLVVAAWWCRRRLREVGLALVGMTVLVAFIVIRAASFHRVDGGLGEEIAGMRLNWILELGALGLTTAGAFVGHASRAARARVLDVVIGENPPEVSRPPAEAPPATPTTDQASAEPAPTPPSLPKSASDGFVVRPIRISEGPRRRDVPEERLGPVRRIVP